MRSMVMLLCLAGCTTGGSATDLARLAVSGKLEGGPRVRPVRDGDACSASWDGERLTLQQLRIRAAARSSGDKPLQVSADTGGAADFRCAYAVFQALEQAGAKSLGFLPEPEGSR